MESAKAKRLEALFKRVLSDVSPSKEEAVKTAASAKMLTDRLRRIAPSDVKIVITGSIAKGTDLRGSKDIDVFMLFDKKKKKEEIVKKGLEYGKRMVDAKRGERYEIRYAEHPYIRLYLDSLNLKADIVPALKIDNIEEMGTAVDRSPMHTDFINKNLTKDQKGDVRLLKKLLKAHDLYGAELKVKGFSGYLCELLIYQYGSLAKLLDHASNFRLPLYLEPLTKKESRDKELVAKFNSQFVVVDPVDPGRNVAAIVSKKALGRFVVLARMLIDNPSARLFDSDLVPGSKTNRFVKAVIRNAGLQSYLVTVAVADKSEDVVWPQLKKVSEMMIELLKRAGFEVFLAAPLVKGKTGLMFYLAPDYKFKSRLLKGPDALLAKGTNEFIKKHKTAIGFVYRDSTLCALEPSKYRDMEHALRDILGKRLVAGRKDVKMSGARLVVGNLPKEYEDIICMDVKRRLNV